MPNPPLDQELIAAYYDEFAKHPFLKQNGFAFLIDISGRLFKPKGAVTLRDVEGNIEALCVDYHMQWLKTCMFLFCDFDSNLHEQSPLMSFVRLSNPWWWWAVVLEGTVPTCWQHRFWDSLNIDIFHHISTNFSTYIININVGMMYQHTSTTPSRTSSLTAKMVHLATGFYGDFTNKTGDPMVTSWDLIEIAWWCHGEFMGYIDDMVVKSYQIHLNQCWFNAGYDKHH